MRDDIWKGGFFKVKQHSITKKVFCRGQYNKKYVVKCNKKYVVVEENKYVPERSSSTLPRNISVSLYQG